MPHDSLRDFDFEFDGFDYDPLADWDNDEAFAGELGERQAPADDRREESLQEAEDIRSASERIEELFKEMAPRRRVMLGLLRFLQKPQSADSLKDEVDRLQQHDYSVYTSADYAALMECAGAIEKSNADGTAFDDAVEVMPEVVEIDGVEYLKPADGRSIYWLITEDGQAYLDADKPLERLYSLLEEEKQYEAIYRRVLGACAEEGGKAIADIAAMVDKDPLVQQPRMRAPHFVQRLEKCEALQWEGVWRITDIGKLGLERLAGSPDGRVSSNAEVPATSESEE